MKNAAFRNPVTNIVCERKRRRVSKLSKGNNFSNSCKTPLKKKISFGHTIIIVPYGKRALVQLQVRAISAI